MNELFLAITLLCATHEQHVGVKGEMTVPGVEVSGKHYDTHFESFKNGAKCTFVSSSDGGLWVEFRDADGTAVSAKVNANQKSRTR